MPSDRFRNAPHKRIFVFEFTFPDDENFPACSLQCRFVSPITVYIALKLRFPKLDIALGRVTKPAIFVPMPEAAVNENCRLPLWQNNVGFARKLLGVESKAKSLTV